MIAARRVVGASAAVLVLGLSTTWLAHAKLDTEPGTAETVTETRKPCRCPAKEAAIAADEVAAEAAARSKCRFKEARAAEGASAPDGVDAPAAPDAPEAPKKRCRLGGHAEAVAPVAGGDAEVAEAPTDRPKRCSRD